MRSGRSNAVGAAPAVAAAPWRPALLVGAAAAAIRAVWVLIGSREPAGLADPTIYLSAAASIAAGDGYTSILGEPTAYYPPGYPYFLGSIAWIVDVVGLDDHLVLVVGLVQALLGGVAAGALVLAGARLVDRVARVDPVHVGVVAGVVFACWPNLVLHSSLILSESLFLAGFCVLLAALFTWSALPPTGGAVGGDAVSTAASGRGVAAVVVAVTALCTWVRPQSVVLLVPALALAWWLGGLGWQRAARGAALVLVGLVVAVVPWTIRNAVVMDAFVPMSTNTGDNLCIGFHSGATGSFVITDACATDGRYVDGPAIEVRRDAELRDRTVEWIADHPGRIPGLSVDKIVATFAEDDDALSAWESFGADRHLGDGQRTAIRWVSNLYYWVVGIAALAGLVLALRHLPSARREVAGGATTLPGAANQLATVAILGTGVVLPVLFFGDARFKIPVVPCLALLSAMFLVGLLPRRRTEPLAATEPAGTEP